NFGIDKDTSITAASSRRARARPLYFAIPPIAVMKAVAPSSRDVRSPGMSTSTMIVLGVIVVLVIWAIGVYNSLVSMRQRVNQAYADIDVQLRQRHDLVPNLVETVKGYAAHERGTLDEVVKARNAAMTAQGPAQQAAAENMLTGALRQLFAVAEAYPDLKAST